jgi:hypothetical protein
VTGPPTRVFGEERDDARRAVVAAHEEWQGIDYLEVVTAPPEDNQLVLELHWLPNQTDAGRASLVALLDLLEGSPEPIRIASQEGARIRVAEAKRIGAVLRIRVAERGDFSTYTLAVDPGRIDVSGVPPGTPPPRLDPVFSEIDFSFKAGCPARFDCRPAECPAPERDLIAVDYMAKDYASFRQALLDRLPRIAPQWSERHEADLGITLVELLAYLGDQLSYQQDAVANEAYLETARQRTSVRRHAQLVDYAMHEGASARTVVQFEVEEALTLPKRRQLLTRIPVPLGELSPPHGTVLAPPEGVDGERFGQAARGAATVFETEAEAALHPDLGELPIYTWGQSECCIAAGATRVDLEKDVASLLEPGSLLLLEETVGVDTGAAADADPSHRQVVRVRDVQALADPVGGQPLARVSWHEEDALSFPLCVSRLLSGEQRTCAIARGNVVLVSHGETREQFHPEDPGGWPVWDPAATAQPPGVRPGPRPYRFHLDEGPLCRLATAEPDTPLVALREVDPADASPEVLLDSASRPGLTQPWEVAPHGLLAGDAFSHAFAVETETDGRAMLRFGDDRSSRAPDPGSFFKATYRVGVGRDGNVGAGSIAHYLVLPGEAAPNIEAIRQPLPAWGGVDPEPLDRVRENAPAAFRAVSLRAVTEADYEAAAEAHPDVAHARARFRWTGSWHTVFLAIDPVGGAGRGPALAESVRTFVEPYKQTGYDLEVRPPAYASLGIAVHVCAEADRFRPDVEAAVRAALRSLLAPDRVTFGQPLYLSELYAAVEAVDGVDSATVRRFSRVYDHDPPPARPVTADNIDHGLIPIGDDEILRVDDDPSFAEHGWLELTTGGGR